jgi:metallo-beta-lactamase family protein
MQLQFLGATGTVTGSKYLLRHGDATILVDCGLFQGFKQLRLRNWEPLPVAPKTVDAVVLTHAHIDHSGYLPLLARQGFRGRVYCTSATHELCKILLTDSGHLQEEEAKFANRHGFSKHQPALPLYTREDAERCLKLFAPRPFSQDFEALPGLTARLTPSGHMLGSAFVHLNDGRRSVLFSGDIGRPNDPVLRPPVQVPGADYLLVESTYGNRKHEASDALAQLETVINKTAARGGVVVIPAFAVGRAQSLMYGIYQLKKQGRIHQHLPVYLDSPMAIDATRLYHAHRDEHRLSPEECEGMCHAAKIVNKGRGVQGAQRRSWTDGHHLRQWHGHGRTRGAPPQVIRARPSQHHPVRRLPGGRHPWRRDRARRVHRPHPWPGRADPRRGGLARQPFRPRRCRRDPRVGCAASRKHRAEPS